MTPADLPPREAMVFEAIRKAALAGRPCPTNMEIADLLGAASISSSAAAVRRLEVMGLIAVERMHRSRVVSFPDEGIATARVPDPVHQRQRNAAAARRAEMAEHVSEGLTIKEAGRRMGITHHRAYQIWRAVCAEMGELA